MRAILYKIPSLGWILALFFITIVVASPLYFILSEVQKPTEEMWQFIADPIQIDESTTEPSALQGYIKSSLILLLSVGTVSLILGVGLAWITSAYAFRAKKIISILLIMPMAIPTYVSAVMFKEILHEPRNALTLFIRDNYGMEAAADFSIYWKFTLATFVLSFSYYPYIYLASKAAFSRLSSTYLDSSRVLGRSLSATFFKVVLPLSRPAIIAGLMLVLLETINEFGAMKTYGIETLTTAIFKAWLDFDELNSAIRIAAIMMLIVLFLLALERLQRGGKKFHTHSSSSLSHQPNKANLLTKLIIYFSTFVTLGLAFFLPLSKLIQQALLALPDRSIQPYLNLVLSSSSLALRAAILVIIVASLIAYIARIIPKWWVHSLTKINLLGYAIPGAILGVVLLSVKASMHHIAPEFAKIIFHTSTAGLIIAYAIRFLNVGYNPIEAGFKKYLTHLIQASRSHGYK